MYVCIYCFNCIWMYVSVHICKAAFVCQTQPDRCFNTSYKTSTKPPNFLVTYEFPCSFVRFLYLQMVCFSFPLVVSWYCMFIFFFDNSYQPFFNKLAVCTTKFLILHAFSIIFTLRQWRYNAYSLFIVHNDMKIHCRTFY